jgi:hypothetical protein
MGKGKVKVKIFPILNSLTGRSIPEERNPAIQYTKNYVGPNAGLAAV